jgi:GDP-4-dehydro-6-deoxy-D-mannose reductase
VHLAGIAAVMQAAADPGLAVEVNVGLTARLLTAATALRQAGAADPTVIIAGSAEQYGRHDVTTPLDESMPQVPRTVYGATKAAAELFALQAARSSGLRAVVARLFNHTGPGQEPRFLLPALVARALALRDGGDRAVFPIGNTESVRDLLHVRDVVDAYIALAAQAGAGEAYNVASGHGWTTGALAERVLARVGVAATLVQDPALVRPAEVPRLVGDARKLRQATGWAPRFTLDDLLDDLLDAAAR